MDFLAPAKINLALRVQRRRDDGFHEIESLVCPISLYDTLEIEAGGANGIDFECDDPTLPVETNLVTRAAGQFFAACGIKPHVRIRLSKRIPHGAGLGGGSSDAATTLLALDQIFETHLGLERLASIAAELGSDIPLFLYRSAARVHGRGELVEVVAFPHALPLLLIKPPFGVPTPWAYRQWKDSREIPGVPYAEQRTSWGVLQNDLERPVFEKYLFLAALKTWLLARPEVTAALMSGSGSTVFAVLRENNSHTDLTAAVTREFGEDLWCCPAETVG
jgi:4-diphosphocytidyl-2-C-methyl-D-erythritol kinase